jgi:UPF0716 protein FxsA
LLHGIVEPEAVTRALFLGLLASLLMLADGYVLIVVSRMTGLYLLLALAASTGLIGLAVVLIAYRTELRYLRRGVAQGRYPRAQFRRLVPLLAAAVLLIVPGFVTDAAGVALLVRPLGWVLGAWVEWRHRDRFRELYEYLRLRH